MSVSRKKSLVGWVAAAVLLWFTLAPPAHAHAVPVTSTPRPNTILETAPPEVSIQFSEPTVLNLSRIVVLTQAGQEVEAGPLTASTDGTTLSIALPPLNNGTYLVSWQVLSAVDGHTTNGTYSFGIGVTSLGVTTGATDTNVRIAPLSIGARWGTLLGVALLLGLYAFRLFILPSSSLFTRAHLQLGLLGLIALGLGLTLTLIDQSNQHDLWQMANFQTWLGTRFGQMWLLRLLLTGLSGYLLATLWRQQNQTVTAPPLLWWAGLVLSLSIGQTSSLVSHSAALRQGSLVATLVDMAHLAAAAIWIGALMQLAELAEAGRTPPLPQPLQLPGGDLQLQQLLRVLPGQRYVALAQWQGRPVLAKLLVGNKAARHFQRELDGARQLAGQGLNTPQLLADGLCEGEGGWLLFEYLQGAESLWDAWRAVEHQPLLNNFHDRRSLKLRRPACEAPGPS